MKSLILTIFILIATSISIIGCSSSTTNTALYKYNEIQKCYAWDANGQCVVW